MTKWMRLKKILMNKRVLLFTLALFFSAQAFSQLDIGVEAQAYPAGYIIGPRIGYQLEKANIYLKISQNIARRQDFGEHEKENGGGPGFTLGYDRYFGDNWFVGFRTDLWWMKIDWEEKGRLGSTDIFVLQPTLVGGYQFDFGDHWSVIPHAAWGLEVNVVTKGEAVGQGTIMLAGIHTKYRL